MFYVPVDGGSQPDILQVLEMDYVTNNDCEQRWGTVLIDDTMICMFHNNLKGPCNVCNIILIIT